MGDINTGSSSGSINYTFNTTEIISEALEYIGVLTPGQSVSADDLTSSLRALNSMFKSWQAKGINFWTVEFDSKPLNTASLVVGSDSKVYKCIKTHISSAGVTGGQEPITGPHWLAYWYLDNDTSGNAWATATAYSSGDIVLNGGDAYKASSAHTSAAGTEPGVGGSWATVWDLYASDWASAQYYTSANEVSLELEGSSSVWAASTAYIVGDKVIGTDGNAYNCISAHTSTTNDTPITGINYATYWALYKSDTIDILNVAVVDESDSRPYYLENMSRENWYSLNDKHAGFTARPTSFFFDKQERGAKKLYLYPYPDDTDDLLTFSRVRMLEDFDSTTDLMDAPQKWMDAITFGLAERMAIKYRLPQNDILSYTARAERHFNIAKDDDNESGDLRMKPNVGRRGGNKHG